MKILKKHSKQTVPDMIKSLAADYVKMAGHLSEESLTVLLASDVDLPDIEENAQVTLTIYPAHKSSRKFIPEKGLVEVK